MIVAVTGSRKHSDTEMIWAALDGLDVDAVVHGDASGADAIAGAWARHHGVCEIKVPANWLKHGRQAGPIRNQWIIDHVRPHIVLAFPLPKSVGTWHMVNSAVAAGIEVKVIKP